MLFIKTFDASLLPKEHHQNYWTFLQDNNICLKTDTILPTINFLSVSIFHNNMPTRTKSINEGLSQKVLMEMTWWFCSTGAGHV